MNLRLFAARARRSWLVALTLAWLTFAATGHAETKMDEAKRHFVNGVHLFEDRNFAGALVEFEASFELNPTAVALQNIAVCQKGLFRYADAIATLERMQRQFGAQLSADDKKNAEDAIREMKALLGSVVVKVDPADAKVTINDAAVDPAALESPIRLAAGEYRVAAEAPGYQRQEKMVTVTSGSKDSLIEIALVKTAAPAADQAANAAATSGAAPPPPRGFYGFASFGAAALGDNHPEGLMLDRSRTGGYGVLRGGYRFSSLFGLELQLATATFGVGACVGTAECSTVQGDLHLTSSRVGPAARFMTSGAKSRIVGTVGLGVAVHRITYDQTFHQGAQSGAGSYFEIAGGYELNIGKLLLGIGLRLLAENGQKVQIQSITSGGLELGAGFSDW